jgi:superfamily I DNA and/or RNA helicase
LIGNDKQLLPTLFSASVPGLNGFERQGFVSLFTRLKYGYQCPLLNENFRMQPVQARRVEKLLYRRENLNYITGPTSHADMVNRVKMYNHAHFQGRLSTLLWLNVPSGNPIRDKNSKSWYNPTNASVAIMLALHLIEDKVATTGEDIVILVPYNAQHRLVQTAINLLRLKNPTLALKGLSVAKVDGYQGNEFKIAICDLVVAEEVGFVREMNRLNVFVSRSEVALNIVGNSGEMEKNKARFIKWLKPLINYFKEEGQYWTVREAELSAYVQEAQAQGRR